MRDKVVRLLWEKYIIMTILYCVVGNPKRDGQQLGKNLSPDHVKFVFFWR